MTFIWGNIDLGISIGCGRVTNVTNVGVLCQEHGEIHEQYSHVVAFRLVSTSVGWHGFPSCNHGNMRHRSFCVGFRPLGTLGVQ